MNRCFPKASRLLKTSDFRRIFRSHRRLLGKSVCIEYRYGSSSLPRLGITVSRKYGKANLRNRFKRIVREAFRTCPETFPSRIELHVRPRGKHNLEDVSQLAEELKELFGSFASQPSAASSSHLHSG